MSTFKFRLATLLRLREMARDQRRAQLAEAYQAEEAILRERRRVSDHLSELMAECRASAAPGELDLDRLLDARRFEVTLRAEHQDLTEKHEAVRAEVDKRREALVESNRSVRVLELLRERQLEQHREREKVREIKQLDEIAGRVGGQEASL